MVNGSNGEKQSSKWRAVNITAGHYQISLGSSYDSDHLEKIVSQAVEKLFEIKEKIPVDKNMPIGNEVGW